MAENELEKLVVPIEFRIGDSTKKVEEILNKTEDKIEQVDKSAKKASINFDGLTKAIGGSAIALGSLVVAAAGFSVQQARLQVETLNAAKSLSISAQEYSSLIYVFEQSGLQADQLTDFLFQLQGQISGAADGSEDLIKVFNKMGIEIRDTQGNARNSVEVFYELANGLKQFGSEGERNSAIQKLLGENGTRLNVIFEKTSEELQLMAQNAQDLGIAFDEEAGKNSTALVKSMTRLSAIVSGLGRRFANELIPKITPLVDQLSEFLSNSEGIVRIGLEKTAKAIGLALDFMTSPLGKVTAGVVALGAAISTGLIANTVPATAAIVAFGAELAVAAVPAAIVAVGIGLVALAIDDMATASRGGKSVIGELSESLGINAQVVEIIKNAFEGFNIALDLTVLLFNELLNLAGDLAKALGGVVSAIPGLSGVGGAISNAGDTLTTGIANVALSASRNQLNAFRNFRDYAQGSSSATNPALASSPLDIARDYGYLGLAIPPAAAIAYSSRQRMTNEFVGPQIESLPVNVNLSVESGQDAAAVAGKAVERAVNESLQAIQARQ